MKEELKEVQAELKRIRRLEGELRTHRGPVLETATTVLSRLRDTEKALRHVRRFAWVDWLTMRFGKEEQIRQLESANQRISASTQRILAAARQIHP